MILDLYSRRVVGWMVSRRENAGLAKHLFGRVLSARAIAPDQLIVHQDRGAPMTALCFTDLLESLGVERSYSRPRVSNDNAFSESQFKTLKYAPDYPERFEGPEHARQWLTGFFDHYHQRPHEGLALYAPSDLYEGRVNAIHAIRQATLDTHFRKHPERHQRTTKGQAPARFRRDQSPRRTPHRHRRQPAATARSLHRQHAINRGNRTTSHDIEKLNGAVGKG